MSELTAKKKNDIDPNAFIRIFNSNSIVKWKFNDTAESISKEIFQNHGEFGGSVTHLVLLKHEDEQILSDISSKIVALDTLHKEALIRGISLEFSQREPWWGINLQSIGANAFIDKIYGGLLHCDDEYKYALIIKLPSIDYLRQWYEFDLHSKIRREIYIKLISELEETYSLIDHKANTEKSAGFKEIEDIVKKSGYLKRMDFVYNKHLKDIPRFKILDDFQADHPHEIMPD